MTARKRRARARMCALSVGASALLAGWAVEPSQAAENCIVLTGCPEPLPAPEPVPAPPAPSTTTTAPPTTTTTEAPAAPGPAAQPTTADAAVELLRLMNRERERAGVPALTNQRDAAAIAQAWTNRMADTRTLSHNDSYFSAETRRRLQARRLGENVAFNQDVRDAHDRLMASPGHRANILDRGFRGVGIGATYRDGTWWITEDFVEPGTDLHRHSQPVRGRVVPPGGSSPRSATPDLLEAVLSAGSGDADGGFGTLNDMSFVAMPSKQMPEGEAAKLPGALVAVGALALALGLARRLRRRRLTARELTLAPPVGLLALPPASASLL